MSYHLISFPRFAQAGTPTIGDDAVIGTPRNARALATRAPLVHQGTPSMLTARSATFSGL